MDSKGILDPDKGIQFVCNVVFLQYLAELLQYVFLPWQIGVGCDQTPSRQVIFALPLM